MTRAAEAAQGCGRAEVHVRLLRLFASPTYRPPVLPEVALRVLALSHRPDASFEDVGGVLERDPLLAARVLSMAQSALHPAATPVRSLRQAAVRLGLAPLRDVVLAAALELRVFRAPGYERVMERLARHSTATAYLLRALCRRAALDADDAFLCGLLHDVGMAACLVALSDDARGAPLPFAGLEPVLDAVHQEASGLVARLWGLPPELQRLVASHHQLVVGAGPHPLNAALIVAERLAWEHDAGMAPAGEPDAPLDATPAGLFDDACAALGLDAGALRAARADAAAIVAAVGGATGRRRGAGAAERRP